MKPRHLLLAALFWIVVFQCSGCDSPYTSDAGAIEEAILHPLPIHPCQVPRYSVLTETRCRGWEACAACIVSSPTHTQTMAACVSPMGNLCVASCGECYAPFTVLP